MYADRHKTASALFPTGCTAPRQGLPGCLRLGETAGKRPARKLRGRNGVPCGGHSLAVPKGSPAAPLDCDRQQGGEECSSCLPGEQGTLYKSTGSNRQARAVGLRGLGSTFFAYRIPAGTIAPLPDSVAFLSVPCSSPVHIALSGTRGAHYGLAVFQGLRILTLRKDV